MDDAASGGPPLDFPLPIGTPAGGTGAPGDAGELADTERQILDFEQRTWRSPGAKDLAITVELDTTPTRYYQILSGLLDRPEALRYAPVLVNQLRERRGTRAARRTPRALPADAPRRTYGR